VGSYCEHKTRFQLYFTSVIDFSIHSDHFTQLALMNRSCAVHVVIVVVKMSVRK